MYLYIHATMTCYNDMQNTLDPIKPEEQHGYLYGYNEFDVYTKMLMN